MRPTSFAAELTSLPEPFGQIVQVRAGVLCPWGYLALLEMNMPPCYTVFEGVVARGAE